MTKTKETRADQVYTYTSSKLKMLWDNHDTGYVKGMLATLRRGIGRKPGDLPELWGILFDRIPTELLGKNAISYAEWAVYIALTLYAMHQQSNDQCMNEKNVSLGMAMAKFAETDEDKQRRVIQSLHLVATARSPYDLAYHFRSVIQILKSKPTGLDYSILAKELYVVIYNMASGNDSAAVATRWGRDFYRYIYEYGSDKDKGDNNDGQ